VIVGYVGGRFADFYCGYIKFGIWGRQEKVLWFYGGCGVMGVLPCRQWGCCGVVTAVVLCDIFVVVFDDVLTDCPGD